jgi:AcrR family transcriptional regulator
MASRVSVEQRRKDLVDAAFRVMAQFGVQKTTTYAICAEAGVNQSVFHYCFRSKKELFQELIRSVVVEMVDAPVALPTTGYRAHEAVRIVMENAWQHARAHPDRHLVAYELTTMALRDPELADLASWQYQQYFEQAMRAMTMVQDSARVEWPLTADVLGRMVATIMDGLVLGWLADHDDAAAERALAQFVDVIAKLAVDKTE